MKREDLPEGTYLLYGGYGKKSHIVYPGGDDYRSAPAVCGRTPGWYWQGTGDQKEYDKAERLPLCKDCDRSIRGRRT